MFCVKILPGKSYFTDIFYSYTDKYDGLCNAFCGVLDIYCGIQYIGIYNIRLLNILGGGVVCREDEIVRVSGNVVCSFGNT